MDDYLSFHIPLQRTTLKLRDAARAMGEVSASQEEVPLMVQLVENPRFAIPGIDLFHGRVDLLQHDLIHLVLGRGLLPMDEAFTIGFTMGSTHRLSGLGERLFSLISRHIYPEVYQFGEEDIAVFRNAVRLAFISDCAPLDRFDFEPLLDSPLEEARRKIGLETDLLLAYYRIEQARFPNNPAAQRLLDR